MTRCWLVLALAACGDNDAEDAVRGGSRIVVQWNIAEDGTREPTGTLHDAELQEDCYPEDWADGSKRCTPSGGYIAYSDMQCSQRIVIDAQATGDVAGAWDDATCKLGHTYRVGASLGMGPYYWKSSTGCTSTSSTMLWAAGAEIAPDTFAKLERVESNGGRLHGVHLASADGLVWPWQTIDSELGTPCSPGDHQCDPYATSGESYVDAACTQAVAAAYTGCGDAPKLVSIPDSCGTSSHTYRLGEVVYPQALYTIDSNGVCKPSTIDAAAEYHAIGTELSLAETSRRYAEAPGRRLQQIYFAGSGIAVTAGLFDTEIGTPCMFDKATDGVQRCQPFYYGWTSYFSNPGCGTVVRVLSVSHAKAGCTQPQPPPYAANYANNGTSEVRVVGARYTGTLYQLQSSGACGQINMQDADYYAVGDAVAPDSFVALTATTY
jgi:hypothetical protein